MSNRRSLNRGQFLGESEQEDQSNLVDESRLEETDRGCSNEMQAQPMTLEDQYDNLPVQLHKMQEQFHQRQNTVYTHDRDNSSKFTSLHFRNESEYHPNWQSRHAKSISIAQP